ncbi:MAG: NAD(P)/FAD-dependent oxidoreductase [Desulfobacteraceae bacterium]|uniref:Pyridine nucleotide-disulfide oxidoreductase domain-containing protein 2 n=1 Tax=Candidatus Desulfacyla euxinica TaxID=2841693 RepID=A0A8J6T9W6_9DELT|nr:NAD(P)/FAD-dependent oxidoreductase [Candidatus Desulfacyla euxinica]MBL6977514.1 NAD(P)/FAD-dependent oxidoreductase [Desulfobacteraceae bacterium]MBL7216175.1 NAD(P)/FAD-dependent oxidoreductase [Desulfobacteraceae bacterium]
MGEAFDAIIVGGGHNGQILSAYLRKAGLETLVLEKRTEPGGGLCTEEVTIPGFYHNLHAFFLRWIPDLPWFKDLDLARYGVRMIMPDVQTVLPFGDGKSLVFHRDDERTIKSISYFSKKDANQYRGLLKRFRRMNDLIITPETYAPPISFEEKRALLEKSALGRDYLDFSEQTPVALAKELFESEQMRAMLIFLVTTKMFLHDEPGLGYSVPSAIAGALKGSMCRGGSHTLAHGISAFVEAQGGRIQEASHVREITVEGGRAVGVALDDGRTIRARRLVASSVDVPQTFLGMVGEDKLDPGFIEKVKAYKFSKWGLFGVHLALNESINYKASAFDPDVNTGLNYNVGLECLEDLETHMKEIAEGIPPTKPGMQCAQPTLHDPLQAPSGKHTAFLWQFAPYHLKDGGAAAWDRVKEEYLEVCLTRWREYTTNLTRRNIVASYLFTPLDVERKLINMRSGDHCVGRASRDQMLENRPFPGSSPYRTPIEGLYLCGSSTHPFGNITGAPGYNAAKTICEDLGMDPWWRPPDLKAAWSRLH